MRSYGLAAKADAVRHCSCPNCNAKLTSYPRIIEFMTLDVKPETAAALQALASAQGLSVEEYLEQVVRREMPVQDKERIEHVQEVLDKLEAREAKPVAIEKKGLASSQGAHDRMVERASIQPSPREAEINWLAKNRDLSERYGGQWIVIEKDELIANDTDYMKAREVATRRGIKRPLIIFIPTSESGGFMGI